MKLFLIVFTLSFAGCASKDKLNLRAPSHIPRPDKNKSAEQAIQGLNNMSKYINSADYRVERIKKLIVELEKTN